ncbi:MAG: dTMP kinase [Marinomonas sp.]|uniref:dTMP kinase n=1 Tax=unclassified Marinomonas TaxID=196814 RepID=UPI0007AF4D65|nr:MULTISPECIES: dTMP kinase [unclassified Marinomonas]KZM39547.1 thymidylate kinase [Marinomonas sp. SBI22]KZM41883.1 thymidylate kinase [Marinomonas sp. SBI8L]
MRKGKFITLEGGEGSGKSTCIDFIKTWLDENNIEYIVTREPGGTPLAEEIRSLILSHREETVHDETELLLMFAARSQHINEKIKPAIEAGKWVISDRFVDSSYVYQGAARGGDLAKIDQLAAWVLQNCKPDRTLLFDVPVEIGLSRVVKRAQSDRLDDEPIAFHQMVREAFLQRLKTNDHYYLIDAAQSIEQVNQDVKAQLEQLKASF